MNRSIAPSLACSIRYICCGKGLPAAPLNRSEKGDRRFALFATFIPLSFASSNSSSRDFLPAASRKRLFKCGETSAGLALSSFRLGGIGGRRFMLLTLPASLGQQNSPTHL